MQNARCPLCRRTQTRHAAAWSRVMTADRFLSFTVCFQQTLHSNTPHEKDMSLTLPWNAIGFMTRIGGGKQQWKASRHVKRRVSSLVLVDQSVGNGKVNFCFIIIVIIISLEKHTNHTTFRKRGTKSNRRKGKATKKAKASAPTTINITQRT